VGESYNMILVLGMACLNLLLGFIVGAAAAPVK
jgi:hypothetical protein